MIPQQFLLQSKKHGKELTKDVKIKSTVFKGVPMRIYIYLLIENKDSIKRRRNIFILLKMTTEGSIFSRTITVSRRTNRREKCY